MSLQSKEKTASSLFKIISGLLVALASLATIATFCLNYGPWSSDNANKHESIHKNTPPPQSNPSSKQNRPGVIEKTAMFIKNSDGSIVDKQLHILWLPEIQGSMSWSDAQQYIENIRVKGLHGYHDWRLPNKNELLRAAHFDWHHQGFFSMDDSWFWSSTENGPITAWLINMGHAPVAWDDDDLDRFSKSEDVELPHAIRLVRTIK